jgi:CrcB protein
MREFLMVGLGGAIGSMARYAVQVVSLKYLSEEAHWATLIINLIGCFLIGILAGSFLKLNHNQNLLLMTGLCGGFTTFSTFAFDGIRILKTGMYWHFAIYFLASTIGGFLICFGGLALTSK